MERSEYVRHERQCVFVGGQKSEDMKLGSPLFAIFKIEDGIWSLLKLHNTTKSKTHEDLTLGGIDKNY